MKLMSKATAFLITVIHTCTPSNSAVFNSLQKIVKIVYTIQQPASTLYLPLQLSIHSITALIASLPLSMATKAFILVLCGFHVPDSLPYLPGM